MKSFNLLSSLTLIFSLFVCLNLTAQDIEIDSTYTSDQSIYPFNQIEDIYRLSITGNILLENQSSIVRIILIDNMNNEHLVFESYTLIDTLNTFSFSDVCDETCYLDAITPYSLKFEIIDCSLYIDKISYSTTPIEDIDSLRTAMKYEQTLNKVNVINIQVNRKGLRWYAGITDLSLLFYHDKKNTLGRLMLDNMQAFEYYNGGIYELTKDTILPGDSIFCSNLPTSFDWRNRHGATNPNSPYFHDTINGWITIPKDQLNTNGCMCFSHIGITEALANIFYNEQIHLDLSEQHYFNCQSCRVDSLIQHGVFDELSCPLDTSLWSVYYCDSIIDTNFTPNEKIGISGHDYVFLDYLVSNNNYLPVDSLEKSIIRYGPLTFSPSNAGHMMSIVGYVKDPKDGSTMIIVKNSFGTSSGVYGYANLDLDGYYNNPNTVYFTISNFETPINSFIKPYNVKVRDEDGDGYYNWGIGPNPDSTINQTICDCDDSDFTLGPYDSTYHCTPICDSLFYDTVPIVIDSDTLWNSPFLKLIRNTVIVKAGYTLTVKEEVPFQEQAKIIIEPGATLVVDGGKLIGACNNTWKGIQVWGNADSSQYALPGLSCAQGKLILKNGAIIEDAEIAIDLWKRGDYETSGGIVEADSAVFRNNNISLYTVPYQNIHPTNPSVELDNFSYFENCTFEGSNTSDVYFQTHVFLWGVRGINFSACDFSTVMNSGTPQWSSGIKAYEAGFSILPVCTNITSPCTSYDSCSFYGFYSAIEVEGDGSSTNTFLVHTALFNNNTYGVKIDGVDNGSVLFSEFNIGANSTLDTLGCLEAPGVGIHLENATGFAFEENHFMKYSGAPTGNYIGISVVNTQSSDEVYKNYFSNLSYANYSNGQNFEKGIPNQGLCYYCNENTSNYADFYIDSTKSSGIQSNQGNDEQPAGNTFSQSGVTWHFYNGGIHLVDYYYCDTCDYEEPDDNKISKVKKHDISYSNSCPSHYDDNDPPEDLRLPPGDKIQKEQEYINNLTSYNNLKSLYNNLVDGGSTSAELNDIQTSQPQDMWTLRAQLLGDSPHLSMEVLKAASDKTEVFTEAALFDILAANPDELKKEELLKYLEEKQDPLPSYMIDILRNLAYGTTYKTTLLQQMARYNRHKTRAAHDIIRSNLSDSLTNIIELRNWLDNLGGISSDRQIISTYIQEKNFSNAYTLANMLPQLYDLNSKEIQEHNYLMEIITLHDTLYLEGRNIAQLDSLEVADLMLIADSSDGIAGTYAKNILEHNYNCHYMNCPNLDGSVAFKNRKVNLNSLREVYGISISVKPNPARQWAAFDYTLSNNDAKGIITIRDISGKIIQELHVNGKQGQILWDTRQIKPGIYFYTLLSEGFSKSDKIVISE